MILEKSLTAIMVLVAIIAAFVAIPYSALILLLLGIVLSVMTPFTEILERTAYLIIAAAGMWVASFAIAVINRIKP